MLNSVPSAGSSFWLCSNSTHASAYLPAFKSSLPRLKAASAGVGVCANAALETSATTIARTSLVTAVTYVFHRLLRRLLGRLLRRRRDRGDAGIDRWRRGDGYVDCWWRSDTSIGRWRRGCRVRGFDLRRIGLRWIRLRRGIHRRIPARG